MSALQQEDRLLIQDAVDKFIEASYPFEEKEKRLREQGKFGASWPVFAELGWLMLPFSEQAGGLGGGLVDVHVLMRAFGRGLIAEPFSEVVLLAGKTLEFCASPAALQQLFVPMMAGELKPVLAHGEHQADADFYCVTCHARPCADGYQINGVKRVVWQAGAADTYLVTALLEGEPAVFAVNRDTDGVAVSESPTLDTRYAADIAFSDVAVGNDSLVARGEVAATAVKRAVLFTAAALIGEARGIADSLVSMTGEYLRTREQFGTKIMNFQALQHLFADMIIAREEIQSLEWLVSSAVELEDANEMERVIRTAKARLGTVAREIAEIAVQLHGGVGVTDELIVSHYLRRMVTIDSFYGDGQQQLLWLAQRY